MPLDQTGQSGTYRHGPLHTQHRDRATNALTGQLVWQIVPPSPASLPAYRFSSSAKSWPKGPRIWAPNIPVYALG